MLHCSASSIGMHYALLSGSGELRGNMSVLCGLKMFCQAASEGMKGAGICGCQENQQKVNILRGNKWRAKVGRVTCTISLSLPLWRHGCQPCKCSVRVIREQRGPRQEHSQPPDEPSRDAAPQQTSAQGQAHSVRLPARRMGPFSAQPRAILCRRLQAQ